MQESGHKDTELETAFDESGLAEHMRETVECDLQKVAAERDLPMTAMLVALFKSGIQLGWSLCEQMAGVPAAITVN